MKPTLRILLCLTLLPLLLGCTGHRRYAALLDEAEQANRVGRSLPSETQMLEVARHYDRPFHSANNRMRAYYLLGCVYRDRGEAPAALHYYNTATERADTLSKDCDYATLFRVYGQMAEIYEQQFLPQEELKADQNFCWYAYKANDMESYALGYTYMVFPYYMMDDTVQVLNVTQQAYRLYKELGNNRDAARVFPMSIYLLLKQGKYAQAREFMDIFESESGLFDQYGNIEKGREQYYESQGLYYMGIGRVDSAERAYRKIPASTYASERYRGLLSVYKYKKDQDSIAKYAILSGEAILQWESQRQAEAVIQSTAMYDYSRNQRIAEQKEQEAKSARYLNVAFAFLFVIVLLTGYLVYSRARQRQQRREQELRMLKVRYEQALEDYRQECVHHELMLQNYDAARQMNSELVAKLQTAIERTEKELQQKEDYIVACERQLGLTSSAEETINHHLIIKECRNWVAGKSKEQPTITEVEKIPLYYGRFYPHIYEKLTSAQLSPQELLVCVLLLLDFDTYQIVTLLGKSSQSITNSKANANQKLFDKKGAESLLRSLKHLARCNKM